MSIVAGTHRVNTCTNVIGSVSSLTMDPPTPSVWCPYNPTGSGVAANIAAGVAPLLTVLPAWFLILWLTLQSPLVIMV